MKTQTRDALNPNLFSGKLFFAAFLLLPSITHAHSAHFQVHGWWAGFTHPFQGWDHLLTMLAVGVWAAQLRGHAMWLLPFTFVNIMCLGGFIGVNGVQIASAESFILLSGLVFSVFIVGGIRFNIKINALIVAFFAFFHGFAHGQELSNSISFLSYALGFVTATLLLHGLGIVITRLIMKIRTHVVMPPGTR
jgi:urease accessory protein